VTLFLSSFGSFWGGGGESGREEKGRGGLMHRTDFGDRMATNKIITVTIITVLVLLIIAVIVSKFR